MSGVLDVRSEAPPAADFARLRGLMGWGELSASQAELCVQRSLAFAVAYDGAQLVAMGRVVGDGAVYFYLQDIAVHPDYRGRGLGRAIVRQLEHYLAQQAPPGACVGLFAARGAEGFYRPFGYRERDGRALGLGMCKFVGERPADA